MKFKITNEHIKLGKPRFCAKCPATLAIKEKLPNSDVKVWTKFVIIDKIKYYSPANLLNFVHNFDNNLPVDEMEFHLSI